MAGSIQEPGVEVIQEFVTTSPTILTPTLPTVVVGPCIQVVDAFNDEGDPQAEALAGTYRDGQGVVSYDLPGLSEGALLTGLTDDIRAFLVYGSVVRELNSESDEIVVDSGTGGTLTLSGLTFVKVGALWVQIGVEVGDAVRFTYRGETIDLYVASVLSDSQLVLESAGPITEASLSGLSFSIVRNAAEFVYSAGTNANTEIGNTTDYLRLNIVTDSEFEGSLGDSLQYEFRDSVHYADGPDGACGDAIFTSATAAFGTWVGTVGTYPTTKYLFVGTTYGAMGGSTRPLKQIRSVVSGTVITIATGLGVSLSSLTYKVAESVATGTNGATNGTGTLFTSAGADFLTAIPNTAGTPTNTDTFIEIGSDGVYQITAVTATTLTITPAATFSLTGQTYRVAYRTNGIGTAADGATSALTNFVSASGTFTDIPNTSGTPNQSTFVSRGQLAGENRAIATITSAKALVLGSGFATSFVQSPWQAVDEDADLTLSYDPDAKLITVQIARVGGVSSSTYASILAAINTLSDPAYNATVSAIVSATLTGSGTILGTDVAYGASPISGYFDGGSDASDLLLDADLLGSSTPTASLYVSYRALRTDVSPANLNPVLTEITSTDDIETKLGVISVENPLALGAYYALLNSPSAAVKALGVEAISASKPDGTAEAYTSAFEFLEGFDVYTIIPLTQDPVVHSILKTHVDSMSASGNKSERIGFVNQAMPLYQKATVIASGVDGNTGATFTTNALAEFSASVDFTAADVQPGDILVVTANASSTDSPDAVNGTVGPLYGINIISVKSGDDFVLQLDGTQTGVSTDWNSLVDVSFTVYRAGAAISQPSDQAEQVALIGEGFADRRMFHHWPDQATSDVQGTEQIVEGFYVASAWGGKVGEVAPERPFTRLSIAGFTGLKHSNGYFSRSQLDRIAGGGTFISVQDSQSSPVRCRHQLSTDVSTLQKRELSITKAVDYCAKFIRTSLEKHIGSFNITQQYLDALTAVMAGLLRSLVESGRVRDAKLVELSVDDVQPDKINVTVALSVLDPANYIVVTLRV